MNIFVKRRVQRRTRRSHWIRPGRTDLWWRNMIEGCCLPEQWKKKTSVVHHLENDVHAPLAQDYTVCGFISEIMPEFVFSLRDTRMKCHTRTRISFGLKTRMNSFRNNLCGNNVSSWYHVLTKQIQGNIWGLNELVQGRTSFRYLVNGPHISCIIYCKVL